MGILTDLGADLQVVRSEEGRPSVVARIGSGERPRLAWNGHLDTVPAGDPSTWSSGPFEGAVVDGRLVGRGACDMKGPIASALAAVAALRRAGLSLAGTLELHLVADEEHAGIHGTKVLRDQGLLDQDAADRRRAVRDGDRAGRTRGRLGERRGARQGGPRLAAGPRRQRDPHDVAVLASTAGGAPRPHASSGRRADRQRRAGVRRERAQRRAGPLRGGDRSSDRAGRGRSGGGARPVPSAGRRRSWRSDRRRTSTSR